MKLRRRLLLVVACGTLAVPHLLAQPQDGKVYRVGFLGTAFASGYVREVDWIREGLRKVGLVEGKNITIDTAGQRANPSEPWKSHGNSWR